MNKTSEQSQPLSLLVFGAGAIGTYIGGSLALSGHQVTFLERPEIAGELIQRGLHLSLDEGEKHLSSPRVVSALAIALDQGPIDAAIFALKSNDTLIALEQIVPFAATMPPVLCLQNGVENEASLAGVLGQERVIAGSVTSAIGRRAAGDIQLERKRGLGLAAGHALSGRLAEALIQAGIETRLYPNPLAMKWSKMLTNLLANASSAILGITPADVFKNPGLYKLEIQQLREALHVMDAQHLPVLDLPGTPVRLLAWGVRKLPTWLSRPLIRRAVGAGRGGKMPSFYIDLHSGKGSSEVDYLNGAVVRFGSRTGIDTPINRLLNETLMALTRGELPLEEFDHKPYKLLAQAGLS